MTDNHPAKPARWRSYSQLFNTYERNKELLREAEEQAATPESRRAKGLLENSIFCLLGSLVGLTAVNLARGMKPREHELRHRWSRPLHLALLLATAANLAAVAYFAHTYIHSSPEPVQQIFQISNDPRACLDPERLSAVGIPKEALGEKSRT